MFLLVEETEEKETTEEKDLGIWTDPSLRFSVHIAHAVKKANQILGLIRRSFIFLDINLMKQLYRLQSWYDLTWNIVTFFGIHSLRRTWNCWKEYNVAQLRWFLVYIILVTRRDCAAWTCHHCCIVGYVVM